MNLLALKSAKLFFMQIMLSAGNQKSKSRGLYCKKLLASLNVFIRMILLSKGRAGEAWEPRAK